MIYEIFKISDYLWLPTYAFQKEVQIKIYLAL